MKRPVIDVATIQTGKAPKEERIRRAKIMQIRANLGLFLNYDEEKSLSSSNNKRYSKHYKTIDDHENDKAKAMSILLDGKEIPEDLYNKLYETRIELYGNKIPQLKILEDAE